MLALKRKSGKSVAISTAEAFYLVFCALPKRDRLTVARFIFENEDIQQDFEIPNETTIEAFEEDESGLPLFHSIEELRKDLLA